MSERMMEVGVVKEIWRYPVKSMQGERVEAADVYWYGLDGDRRYAFVKSEDRTPFPWLTARDVPMLVRYKPRFSHAADPVQSPIRVTTPNGREYPLTDEALRAELEAAYGRAVHLMQLNRGAHDSLCLSFVSTATLNYLSQQFGPPLDKRRFRQNLILETHAQTPFGEESWTGHTLILGDRSDSVQLLAARRIQRCVMINVDPDTGERDARVLKGVLAAKDNCVGIYAWPKAIGTLREGDKVWLVTE